MATVAELLAALDAQIAQLRRLTEETKNTIEALKSLTKEKELMVPLGGGVLLRAEYKDRILLDVGGGIFLEKSPDEVIKKLENRIKRAEEEVKRLEEERKKIISQVERGSR